VGIHYIERHLYRIEMEVVICRDSQRIQVDVGIFVAGKSDVSNLAGFLCGQDRLHCPTFRENTVGIVEANNFVMLQQIDVVGLQAF